MKPLRIAYVINSVEGGGAALPVPAVTQVLRDGGAEVRVFALLRRDGLALPPMVRAGLRPLVRDGQEKDHLRALRWLDRELQNWGATHIWTSLSRATILGLLIGPRRHLPVICWQHAAYLKPWNRRLMRLLQSRAQLWVGDSASVSALTSARLGVPPERLATWPIFAADPATPQASPWQPGETLRIGSLGRLFPVKGYDVLIAALTRLKAQGFTPACPFSLTIAGEGSARADLTARATALNNVQFPGFVDAPQSFLAGLHLYVQPSRSEGFCIAAHEAMVSGLPVIASAVGELPYTIRDGVNGFLVPPGEVNALAEKLAGLLSHPERLSAIGQAARHYTLSHFTQAGFRAAGTEILRRVTAASA